MAKRVGIRGNIIQIDRVRNGQPIRCSAHHKDKVSQASWTRLFIELSVAWHESRRDAGRRWIPSVTAWESPREQAERIIARVEAKELACAQQRQTKDILQAVVWEAAVKPRRRPA